MKPTIEESRGGMELDGFFIVHFRIRYHCMYVIAGWTGYPWSFRREEWKEIYLFLGSGVDREPHFLVHESYEPSLDLPTSWRSTVYHQLQFPTSSLLLFSLCSPFFLLFFFSLFIICFTSLVRIDFLFI